MGIKRLCDFCWSLSKVRGRWFLFCGSGPSWDTIGISMGILWWCLVRSCLGTTRIFAICVVKLQNCRHSIKLQRLMQRMQRLHIWWAFADFLALSIFERPKQKWTASCSHVLFILYLPTPLMSMLGDWLPDPLQNVFSQKCPDSLPWSLMHVKYCFLRLMNKT